MPVGYPYQVDPAMPAPHTALAAALASLAVGFPSTPAVGVPDLSKLDRAIKKEPAYAA